MARIDYPTRESLQAEAAQALDGMKPMNVFRMMARADSLAPPIFEATTRLFRKGGVELAPRLRQVAILRTAGETRCDYLVAHHEPISRRVGMSDLDIAACISGDSASLSDADRAVMQFTTESTSNVDVSDAAFAAVRKLLSDRQIAELTLVVGLYNCIARFLKGLRVDIE
ncbi:MAG: carboxymuconolactone decarboxylase family protein [Burkholderiales bacterium]|nr:carboxymuconolactone decarboxylase family protein [Burkholderiales bacterium]ODU72414.1 MAG: hypothetical protein ABT05_00160 [Lautropia sp. SCN 66-9]